MYSLRDATIKIDDLIERLKELGQTSIAITDHGNLYAAVEAYRKFTNAGLKVINGCEMYICDSVLAKGRNYHIILLAKNETGRVNLQKLVSMSSNFKYRKPRIDFPLLHSYSDGLICLSACMAGEVSSALMNDDIEEAKSIALRYKKVFGDDYYLEYQAHHTPEQQELNTKICKLADELGIELAVTADAHYLTKEDKKYHKVFAELSESREVGEIYEDCYIQSADEILSNTKSTAQWNERAMQNTVTISEKCENTIPLSAPIIPHIELPAVYKSEEEYLRCLCDKGFSDKGFESWTLKDWQDYMRVTVVKDDGIVHTSYSVNVESAEQMRAMYTERYEYEMNALVKMGFVGYYLMVYDYVHSAEHHGIARGSGGGSLLAYLCGIVDIDPIKNGLYFERFIDVGALDLLESGQITKNELKIPDFDVDFPPNERENVLKYIIDRYGENRVVSLGQFQYLKLKGTLKDIGRILNIPFDELNAATRSIGNDETIEDVQDNEHLKPLFKRYPEFADYVSHLSGLPKSFGVHPCGKVITVRESDYYQAIENNDKQNVQVIQLDGTSAEALGLVKVDLLGLRTLSTIYDTLSMIGKDYNYIAPHLIDMSDKAVWDEFKKGNTNCIFQFESGGMKQTLKDMQCETLDELSAANALFRPGSMDYIKTYVARKNGSEEIKYLHPDLEPILRNTYGIMVFQEQLIEIGRLAKLRNPDELRRATAKKKLSLMQKIEPLLKSGLISRGWTEEQTDMLWTDILKFAKYSFNKSHSSAYALTAYITMYLKVHHPAEFMTADINSREGDAESVKDSIYEAKRMGVKIAFPKWGHIKGKAYCKDGIIYLGTEMIKGFSSKLGDAIESIQSEKFSSVFDMFIRCKENKIQFAGLTALAKLGSFSEMGKDSKMLKLIDFADECIKNEKGAVKTRSYFTKGKCPVNEELIRKFASETDTMFNKIRYRDMFNYIMSDIEGINMTIKSRLAEENSLLEVCITADSKWQGYLYVIDVDKKYSPKIEAYSLKNGTFLSVKVDKKTFNRSPIYVGDIIKVSKSDSKPKVFKNSNGDFEEIPNEKEIWLKKYETKF